MKANRLGTPCAGRSKETSEGIDEFSQPLSGDHYPNIAWPHHVGKRHKRAADGQLNARRSRANGSLHANILGFSIFQMVKVTEIVAGFMLVFGIFPALATLFLAPDVVGIVIVNARLMPSFLWLGAIVFVLTAYLGYAYWDKYKSLFEGT